MSNNHHEPQTESMAETENYMVWKAEEPDGETTYHVEVNNVTVHFFQEEWDEFVSQLDDVTDVEPDEDGLYPLQFNNVDIWLQPEEWTEFKELIHVLKG